MRKKGGNVNGIYQQCYELNVSRWNVVKDYEPFSAKMGPGILIPPRDLPRPSSRNLD